MTGSLAVSWGPWGGFYVHPRRLCLGWVALTYVPVEIDDLMEAYADTGTGFDRRWKALRAAQGAMARRMAGDARLYLPYDEDMADALRLVHAALGGDDA